MKEVHNPEFGSGRGAYVLGARSGSGNIGDAIVQNLKAHGWNVTVDDGAVGDGSRPPGGNIPSPEVAEEFGYSETEKGHYQRFEAPAVSSFIQADLELLVVTMGKTYKQHFSEIPDWTVGQMIRANLILPLEAARRFVQATHDTGYLKRIIFIGSYAHSHPFTNGTLYCAAKAGLDMATRTLAWELTDQDYRVHIIHPYHVPGTPMWKEVEQGVMESKGWTKEQAREYASKDLKMPDHLTPFEIADVVIALVNTEALEWMTGQPINLYGGSR